VSRRAGWLPNGRTRILGIVGRPLEHSLSPTIHTAVLRALDRNLIYLPLPVSEDRLPGLLAEAPGLGILGFNVTTPYKETVARLVRPLDEETASTGMVNTVVIAEGGPAGCGTDGAGILRYLQIAGLGGVPYGVLGFGASARSLTHRGWLDGHAPAVIVTRRPDEVRAVLASWSEAQSVRGMRVAGDERSTLPERNGPPERSGQAERSGPAERIAVTGWDGLGVETGQVGAKVASLPRPDVWVSTLRPDIPTLPEQFWAWAGTGTVLLDLNYGFDRTVRMEEARMHGWWSADGLGPLCCQAALSLSLWLGEDVPVGMYVRALGGRTERSLRPGR
jgi:shikimate dehydrogenase